MKNFKMMTVAMADTTIKPVVAMVTIFPWLISIKVQFCCCSIIWVGCVWMGCHVWLHNHSHVGGCSAWRPLEAYITRKFLSRNEVFHRQFSEMFSHWIFFCMCYSKLLWKKRYQFQTSKNANIFSNFYPSGKSDNHRLRLRKLVVGFSTFQQCIWKNTNI